MSIGNKLKWLRLRAGRTLQEQSEVLNVSANSIHRWENGLSMPRMHTLLCIADHFKVSYEWLLSDDMARLAPLSPVPANDSKRIVELHNHLSFDSQNALYNYAEFLLQKETQLSNDADAPAS